MFAIILLGLSVFIDGSVSLRGVATALVITLALAALIWWTIPMNARRKYHQRKMWDEVHFNWDDRGVTLTSNHGSGNFAWDEFFTWATDKRTVLLYLDPRLFYVLPLRAFPFGASNDIVAALASAGVKPR